MLMHTIRPESVREVVSDFIDQKFLGRHYLAIHWRYDIHSSFGKGCLELQHNLHGIDASDHHDRHYQETRAYIGSGLGVFFSIFQVGEKYIFDPNLHTYKTLFNFTKWASSD